MKKKIEKWYCQGLWTSSMVANAAIKGIISWEDYQAITGMTQPE